MLRLTVCITIIVLFARCFCDAKEKEDWLIVPGARIGQVVIGMEHAEVLRLLGAPHRQDDLSYLSDGEESRKFKDLLRDDWITPLPVSAHPEQSEGVFMANFVTVYTRKRRVVQIEVRAPRFKTTAGLSSASTGIEWRKHFPHYRENRQVFGHASIGGWPATKHFITFEDDLKSGITWRYAAMGNLAPDPEPEERVEAIAVHTSGQPLIVDPDGGSRFIWKDDPHRLSTEN